MSKRYIKTFLAALANLADTWNEPTDTDEGPENDPVMLVLYQDGSGFIGNGSGVYKVKGINFAMMDHVTIQGEFDDLDQAFEYLHPWLDDEEKVELDV